jgi:HPt (histidine-containing phosphotransfer) domain-containing protein
MPTSANVVNVSFTKWRKDLRGFIQRDAEPVTHDPIDFVHLARQSGGDEALEAELLALFADQCVRQLSRITDAARDVAQRRDAAHTLKGAALAIGAWEVAEAANEIETALQGGQDISTTRMTGAAEDARRSIAALAAA